MPPRSGKAAAPAVKRKRSPKSPTVNIQAPEEIFSPDYLAFYYSPNRTGYVMDPKNAFNSGVGAAAATFTSLASGAGDGMLSTYGMKALRTAVDRDSVVLEIQDNQGLLRMRAEHPSLEVIPTMKLQPQWVQAVVLDVEVTMQLLGATGARKIELTVVSPAGVAIADAKVILVYDAARRAGVEVFTGADGTVKVAVPASLNTLDSIAVVPSHSYWAYGVAQWPVPAAAATVTLQPLNGSHQGQFSYLGNSLPTDGAGVKVAVIDSGVGPHPALIVTDGENLVLPGQEDPAHVGLHTDNGLGHGTHVAGIIAARDLGNGEHAGIAPAVTLYSYRVFAKGQRNGDDAAIAAAIDAAVDEGCDLINLSLGFQAESRLITRAVRRAFANGAVAIAAVGNAAGQSVYFPAATPGVIGVTAIGRKSRLPANTVSSMTFHQPPSGNDPEDFVGLFCNKGHGVTVAAPGVGIVSCAPGGFYAAEDGTSMAAPVVTGYAAKVLAKAPNILNMERKQDRADAIRALILQSCDQLGFPIEYVGNGHPK